MIADTSKSLVQTSSKKASLPLDLQGLDNSSRFVSFDQFPQTLFPFTTVTDGLRPNVTTFACQVSRWLLTPSSQNPKIKAVSVF